MTYFHGDHLDPDEDVVEPVGSCDDCGANLYEEDDPYLCDQCAWWTAQADETASGASTR